MLECWNFIAVEEFFPNRKGLLWNFNSKSPNALTLIHLLSNTVAKNAFIFLIFFILFLLLIHYNFSYYNNISWKWCRLSEKGLHQGNEHLRHISRFIFQTLKKGWSEITFSDWWINIEITLDAIAPGYDHKSESKWEEPSLLPKANSDEKNLELMTSQINNIWQSKSIADGITIILHKWFVHFSWKQLPQIPILFNYQKKLR